MWPRIPAGRFSKPVRTFLDRYAIPPHCRTRYLGRAQPARLVTKPVLPPRPRSKTFPDPGAWYYTSVAARLRELAMVKRITVDLPQVNIHSNILISNISGLDFPADMAGIKTDTRIDITLFRSALAKLENATAQDCLVLHHQAQMLANAQMRLVRKSSYTSFRSWLAESMVNGAKRAHHWPAIPTANF